MLRKVFTANIVKASLGGCFIFAALHAPPAKALMVTVGGATYDIGFEVGCFTNNFEPATGYSPGCGTDGTTTYTTPDLYASGVLASQPWWGDATLALAFANAYSASARNAPDHPSNACAYLPNLNGNSNCADSP